MSTVTVKTAVERYDFEDYGTLEESGRYVKFEDYAELAAQRDALATENAALKSAFNPEEIPEEAVEAFTETAIMDHDWNDTSEWSWVENDTDVIRAVLAVMTAPETPATDAFLREVRAQGAEACVKALATSDDDDFIDAPNICACVAYQLRKGGAA